MLQGAGKSDELSLVIQDTTITLRMRDNTLVFSVFRFIQRNAHNILLRIWQN